MKNVQNKIKSILSFIYFIYVLSHFGRHNDITTTYYVNIHFQFCLSKIHTLLHVLFTEFTACGQLFLSRQTVILIQVAKLPAYTEHKV